MSNTVFILDTSSSGGHDSEDDSNVSLHIRPTAGPNASRRGPRHATSNCRLTGHLDRDAHTVYTGASSATAAPSPTRTHIREFARYARALAKHGARQAAITAMQTRIAKRRAAVQLARMRAHDRSLTVETERRRAMQPVRDEILAVRAQCDAVRKELARLDAEERAVRDEFDLDQRADAAASAVKLAFQAMTAAQREYDREVELARDRDRDLVRAQQLRDRRRPSAPVIPPSSSPPPAAAAVWDLDEYMMRVVDPVDEEEEVEDLPLRGNALAPVPATRIAPLLPAPAPRGPAKPALRFGKVNLAPLVGRRGAGGVGRGAKGVKAKGQRTLDVYFKK
ncbi:hypothetical protein GGF31_005027 [Allomyces arbusculus]|nr:hypothetical protein GGF31_005027 [Allomyces arbusculus]